MSNPAQVTFNIQSQTVHQASGSFPTGSVGLVTAGLDELGKVRYLSTTQQGYTITLDQKLAIAMGTVSGSYFRRQFEYDGTGTANTYHNFRGLGPDFVYSSQITASNGTRLQVVSNNANDTAAGTGIRKILISYLDANLDRYSEELTLNGTTPVLTTRTNIRYLDHYDITDRGGVLGGTVTLKTSPDNVTLFTISNASTLVQDPWSGHFVPRNKTAVITDIQLNYAMGSNGFVLMNSWKLYTDGRNTISSANAGSGEITYHIFRARAQNSSDNEYSDNAQYVVQGPAMFYFQGYTSDTSAGLLGYSIYEQ